MTLAFDTLPDATKRNLVKALEAYRMRDDSLVAMRLNAAAHYLAHNPVPTIIDALEVTQ